jgi:hypothetical protein
MVPSISKAHDMQQARCTVSHTVWYKVWYEVKFHLDVRYRRNDLAEERLATRFYRFF